MSLSLTSRAHRIGGRLCHEYQIQGKQVMVCDSTMNALLVIELFSDTEMTENQKANVLPLMLFPDAEQALYGFSEPLRAICDILWEAFGLDAAHEHEDEYGEQVFDWEQDAERIVASLQMAYGLDWNTVADGRSFKETSALLGMLLETKDSTPFGEALYYRTAKPPKPNKYNEDERTRFMEMKRHFALRSEGDNAPDSDATALFDRLWKEVS